MAIPVANLPFSEDGDGRTSGPLTPQQQTAILAAVVAAFALTDEDITALRTAILTGRIASYQAAYLEAANLVGADDETTDEILDPMEEQDQEDASDEDAESVANTYHNDLLNQALNLLGLIPPGMGEEEVQAQVAQGVARWADTRAEWKAKQVASYETGAGANAGTNAAVGDILDGEIDLPEGLTTDDVYVTVLPEFSSTDFCADYAGEVFALDQYYDLPDFPAHANCIHEKVIILGNYGEASAELAEEALFSSEEILQDYLDSMAEADAAAGAVDELAPAVLTPVHGAPMPPLTAQPPQIRNLMRPDGSLITSRPRASKEEIARLRAARDAQLARERAAADRWREAKRTLDETPRFGSDHSGYNGTTAAFSQAQDALNAVRQDWEREVYAREQADAALSKAEGGRGAIVHLKQYDGPDDTATADAIRVLFGRDLTNDELASLVGAPEGSYVDIAGGRAAARKDAYLGIELMGPSFDPLAPDRYVAQQRAEYYASREIGVMSGRNGALKISNESFAVREDLQQSGIGSAIFADQAHSLSELGFRKIETDAAGWLNSGANGYYTWPRLGYDAKIPERELRLLEQAVADGKAPAAWERYTKISQLFKTPEGREWWKLNAHGSIHMEFDLRPGSKSLKTLDAYLTERAATAAEKEAAERVAALAATPGALLAQRLSEIDALGDKAKDVVAWLTRTFPDVEFALKSATDVTVLKDAARTLSRLADEYPEQFAQLHFFGLSSDAKAKPFMAEAFPETNGKPPKGWSGGAFHLNEFDSASALRRQDGMGMLFPAAWWKNGDKVVAVANEAAAKGFWVAGAAGHGIDYVITHEFGHVVAESVEAGVGGDLAKAALERLSAHSMDYLAGGVGYPATLLSDYGKKTVDEALAEGFAALHFSPANIVEQEFVQRLQSVLDLARGVDGAEERVTAFERLHPREIAKPVVETATSVVEDVAAIDPAGERTGTDVLTTRIEAAQSATEVDGLLHEQYSHIEFNFDAPDPLHQMYVDLREKYPDEPEFQRIPREVMDPAIAKDLANNFLTLAREYPEAVARLEFVGLPDTEHVELLQRLGMSGGGMVEAQEEGKALVFGPMWREAESLAKSFGMNVGYTLEGGTNPLTVMRHEFGHLVQFAIEEMPAADRAIYDAWRAKYPYADSLVSEYARRNEHEQFAEAFAALRDGVPAVRNLPEVQELGAVLHDLFPQTPIPEPVDQTLIGKTTVVVKEQDRAALSQWLGGREVTNADLAGIVGAQTGDTVTMTFAGDIAYLSMQGPRLSADSVTSAYTAQRTLERDAEGNLYVYNRGFVVDKTRQGEGLGTRIFADEVRTLDQLGVDYIKTDAGRMAGTNGYYTWARLGYDGPIPESVVAKLPPEYAGYTRVSQIMATPEGRAWWKANGSDWTGTFDLHEGSYSRRVLDTYLEERGLAATTTEAETQAAEAGETVAKPAASSQLSSFGADLGTEAELRVSDEHNSFFGTENANRGYYHEPTLKRVYRDISGALQDNADFQALVDYFKADARWEVKNGRDTVEALFSAYHQSFSHESGPLRDLVIAMQEAIRQEFGLDATIIGTERQINRALARYNDVLPGVRAVVRQMYDNTQAWFAEHGITDVNVFRGMAWSAAKRPAGVVWDGSLQRIAFDFQPMSSFSTDAWRASLYSDRPYAMLTAANVPVERILSIPFTGLGAFGDEEVLVLGGHEQMWAQPVHEANSNVLKFDKEAIYRDFGTLPRADEEGQPPRLLSLFSGGNEIDTDVPWPDPGDFASYPRQQFGQGTSLNQTYSFTDADGNKFFAKKLGLPRTAQMEQLATDLGQYTAHPEMFVPTRVYMDGRQPYLVQPWLDRTQLGELGRGRTEDDIRVAVRSMPREQQWNALLHQYLVGDTDRNVGNILVTSDLQKVVSIDFGQAWSRPDRSDVITWERHLQGRAQPWEITGNALLSNVRAATVISQDEIAAIVANRDAILARAARDSLLTPDELDDLRTRLDVLGHLSTYSMPTAQDFVDLMQQALDGTLPPFTGTVQKTAPKLLAHRGYVRLLLQSSAGQGVIINLERATVAATPAGMPLLDVLLLDDWTLCSEAERTALPDLLALLPVETQHQAQAVLTAGGEREEDTTWQRVHQHR